MIQMAVHLHHSEGSRLQEEYYSHMEHKKNISQKIKSTLCPSIELTSSTNYTNCEKVHVVQKQPCDNLFIFDYRMIVSVLWVWCCVFTYIEFFFSNIYTFCRQWKWVWPHYATYADCTHLLIHNPDLHIFKCVRPQPVFFNLFLLL